MNDFFKENFSSQIFSYKFLGNQYYTVKKADTILKNCTIIS